MFDQFLLTINAWMLGNFDRRDSLNILKRRLASGEITLEAFEKLKSVH